MDFEYLWISTSISHLKMHQIEAKFRSSHNGLMIIIQYGCICSMDCLTVAHMSPSWCIYNIIWILYNMDVHIYIFMYHMDNMYILYIGYYTLYRQCGKPNAINRPGVITIFKGFVKHPQMVGVLCFEFSHYSI